MGFVTRQIKQVVLQEQRTLEHYSSGKRMIIYGIENSCHGYKSDQDAWHMVKYYDEKIEECKDKIAAWLGLFK